MDAKTMTAEQKIKAFVKKHFKNGKIKYEFSDFPSLSYSTIYYKKNQQTGVKEQFYSNLMLNDGKVVTTSVRPTFYNAKRTNMKETDGAVCLSTGVYFKLAYFKCDTELEVASFTQIWVKSNKNRPESMHDLTVYVGETYMIAKGFPKVFTKDGEIDYKNGQFKTIRDWRTYERGIGCWHEIHHFDDSVYVYGFANYLGEIGRSTASNVREFKKLFPENTWVSASGGKLNPSTYNVKGWFKGYIKNTERVFRDHQTPKEKQAAKLLSEVKLSEVSEIKDLFLKNANNLQIDMRYAYDWVYLDPEEADKLNYRGIVSEISDGYVVLRVFTVAAKIQRENRGYYYNSFNVKDISSKEIIGEPTETARIYLSETKDNFIFGMIYDAVNKMWVPMNKNIVEDYNNTPICNPENIKKSVKVKYTLEMCMGYTKFLEDRREYMPKRPDILSLTALFAAVKHPIAEQMYKAGYPYVAYQLLTNGSKKFQKNILGYEGVIKPGELFKKIDMNKSQLKFLNDALKEDIIDHHSIFNYNWVGFEGKPYHFLFKFFANAKVFKDIDDETAKYAIISALRFFSAFSHLYGADIFMDTNMYESYEQRDARVLNNPKKIEWLKVIAKIAWKDNKNEINNIRTNSNRVFKLARDTTLSYNRYLGLVLGYNRRVDVNLAELVENNGYYVIDFSNITSYNDLVRLHDAVTALANNIQNERDKVRLEEEENRHKKFIKKRKELFEYSDNEYMIRVPEKLEEITKEGAVLAHCVAGYVTNVANGQTNIVFLRKKSAPMTPFYTIEVKNDKLIQVHGYRNKHLGLNPEAVPFILRWLRDKNIHYMDSQVLDTGAGYSPNHILIPKPVI